MLPIVWSAKAEADLLSIVEYVAERSPKAAERLAEAIRTSTWPLSEHPYIFKSSQRVSGCREIIVHPNYIVLYRVELDRIQVMRVVHARRDFPKNTT